MLFCEDRLIFQNGAEKVSVFRFHWFSPDQMLQGVHMKLNPELPWQKQHSRKRLFSPANWT
jgi:hypothetical protein